MLSDVKSQIVGRRYELHDIIGRGGMGRVYRAVDRLTGHEVALKQVLRMADDLGSTTTENDFRLALAREFKMLASLQHPHIIEVLDYGFDEDHMPYFTMELLHDARSLLDAGYGQPLMQKLNYLVQTLYALAYLHRRGVLHRDLKPGNVLVANGQVKVLDFGLSTMQDRTSSGEYDNSTTAGTLAYMAPEVMVGSPADETADLYALGMMAYELIAEAHPYDTNNIGQLVNDVLYKVPDTEALDISMELSLVLHQLLQKDPSSRYRTAYDVIQALGQAAHEPISEETVEMRESFLSAARFVGREAEMAHLRDAFLTARGGQGSVWLLAGESGVGKSRIVDEMRILAMVEGALVMRGQAVGEGSSPYQMWYPIFRWLGLIGDLDDVDAGLLRLLVPDIATLPRSDVAAAEELEPQKVQTRLLAMLERTIRQQTHPVVILLEDLHWANSESMKLLADLCETAAALRLLVIGTYRDDERPDLPALLPEAALLRIGRLSGGDIAELSRAMLGDVGGQPDVVNLLQRETEGNVFFVIEVVRALAEEAGNLEHIGRMTLPGSVFAGGMEFIIRRRLEAVPKYARRYLEIAAVIGRRQDLTLLKAAAPDIDIKRWLTECAGAAVLENVDGDWQFAHDKLRESILKQLGDKKRRTLNQRVAEALESLGMEQERAAALAHYWRLAEHVIKEEQYVTLAGEQALRRGAYQEAVLFFERALAIIEQAKVKEHTSQMRRVYLQHRKAEAYLGFGGYAQARQLYEDSLMISERLGESKSVAESLYALGGVAHATGDYLRARQLYDRAMTIFEVLGDRAQIARVLHSLGGVAFDLGEDATARVLYQKSLNISREMGNQVGLAGALSIADTQESVSIIEETRRRLTQTLEVYITEDNRRGVANALFELGVVALEANDRDDALENFENVLRMRRELGDIPETIQALVQIGLTYMHFGERDEARLVFRDALKMVIKFNEMNAGLVVLLRMAQLNMAEAHFASAMQVLSFILADDRAPDDVIDEAEQMVFEVEQQLSPAAMEKAWERGKAADFSTLVQDLFSD
ncbi:MAG: hypothetical protein OHK0046_02230 [Anaerolineae bacterium]